MASRQCAPADVFLALNCPKSVYCTRLPDICTVAPHVSSNVSANLKNLRIVLHIQAHDMYKSRLLHHLEMSAVHKLTFKYFTVTIKVDFAFFLFLGLPLKSLIQFFFSIS